MLIEAGDLAPFADIDFAMADAMVTHAQALAITAAPCLKDTTDPDSLAAARAILVGVVLRWYRTGLSSYQIATSDGSDPRRERTNSLWPSEVTDLQALCRSAAGRSEAYVGWLG